MFGAVDFLKNLRSLGFETFGQVVNEHYDSIEDHVRRFDHAFEQCQWLAEQDPREIYSQIQGELEHNCNLVQTLKHKTQQQMQDLLRTKIPKLI
jgi:UTP-glucose-1-phosphate uridylyltransferase